eukprot:6480986-Amphidinium_carterae.1
MGKKAKRRAAAKAAMESGGGATSGLKRDHRGRYLTTADGRAICFVFHGRGCQEPCPAGRAHVCQFCLQSHKNNACPKAPSRSSTAAQSSNSQSSSAQTFQ